MTAIASQIIGVGAYLPEKILTNDDLAKTLDTSDEWIKTRVGIQQRHIAAKDEFTSHLATKAAKNALDHAGVEAQDVDLVIVATTSPDYVNPATATLVQSALGIPPCGAFDVQAVCSGFVYALTTADMYIRSGQSKCALVIGAETMSHLVDWKDRNTCVLFGDGAGAFVLKAAPADSPSKILSSKIYADGQFAQALCTKGVQDQGAFGYLTMNGREVFKYAVVNMAKAIDAVLAENGLTYDAIDFVVPHQANQRILDSLAERLHIPSEKVISTIAHHANTSAATIPLAFHTAIQDGRIQTGHKVIMPAMGGGFTWGASLVVY
ncbi:MAG: ketoacyl-ACP synthase III [Alphaproteobacteria bacterium]|nr:ketoacyl-ACP synthase III [Alphaproteobacteria bacterium]